MWDTFAAAVWSLLTMLVMAAAWTVSKRLFPTDTFSQQMRHGIILMWMWLVVVSSITGACGMLHAVGLGIGVLCAAALTCVVVTKTSPKMPPGGMCHTGPDVTADAVGEFPGETASGWFKTSLPNTSLRLFWHLTAGLAVVLVAMHGVLEFPSDWDTLMYHRPLIDLWIQSGTLYVPQCAVWYNPSGHELIGLWLAVPFSGDFWVGLVNLPVILLMGLSAYELGRLLEFNFLQRHAAVLAIVGSSIAFLQIVNSKNDLAVCALFLAGAAYGIRYIQDRRGPDLILGGAAFGLVAGVKYYALGYAVIGGSSLLLMAWCRDGVRGAAYAGLAAGGMMLVTGGAWYARNALVTGSPIHPSGHSAQSEAKTPMGRSTWHSSIIGNGDIDVWPQYVEATWKRGGLCQTLSVLALPTSTLWLMGTSFLALARGEHTAQFAVRLGLSVMLLGSWLNFGVTPYTMSQVNENLLDGPYLVMRFSQVPLALSVLAFSLLLADFSRWAGSTAGRPVLPLMISAGLSMAFLALAITTFAVNTFTAIEDDWLLKSLLAVNAGVLLLIMHGVLGQWNDTGGGVPPLALTSTVFGVAVALALSTTWLSNWWHRHFAGHYDARYGTRIFSLLERWPATPPAIVALHYRYYPFFGSRRQFRACRPRRIHTEEFLFAYLEWHGADVVVTMNRVPFRFGNYDGAHEWMKDSPDVFSVADRSPNLTVYQVHQDVLRERLEGVELMSDGRHPW